MILDAIIGLVMSVLTGVLGLIPAFTFDLAAAGYNLGAALVGSNAVFPTVTLGLCIVTVIGLRLFIALVAFIAWVWDKIPFTFK